MMPRVSRPETGATMLRSLTAALILVLAATVARGQQPYSGAPPTTIEGEPEAAMPEENWTFALPINVYVVPDESDYLQPTLTADKGQLHLEARYNYEDRDTASVWFGWNMAGGNEWAWRFTPMFGLVFGDSDGWAPGFRGALDWKGFELYSEAEYVVGTDSSTDNFFYSWSELTYSLKPFRVGLVAQHTKANDSGRDIDRGFLVGLALKRVQITATVLNPDDDSTLIVGASFGI
jgi:hypothetical protein